MGREPARRLCPLAVSPGRGMGAREGQGGAEPAHPAEEESWQGLYCSQYLPEEPWQSVPLFLPHRGNRLQAAALADGTVTEPGVAGRSVQTPPNASEDAVEDNATSINIQDCCVGTYNIFLKAATNM